MRRARFMVAAAHKSSGKTVVSTGLAAALRARCHEVAPFKKGPDYIDPMWLGAASGRPAYNLDFNTMGRDEIRALFARHAIADGINLVEANKGLFDGVNVDGSDSNAELAKLLQTPVVLVIDAKGMTRGVAPLLLGYTKFDPDIRIAGIILNKTASERHEQKLRAAVEAYTDLDILGVIRHDPTLDVTERHLGLITPAEKPGMDRFVERLGGAIADQVDLDRVEAIAHDAGPLDHIPVAIPKDRAGTGLRIGYARDAAFSFYYPDDLDRFRAAGAELVPVDLIKGGTLPRIDGLFIGGGFPEMRMDALSDNAPMRQSVRHALAAGLPCYAECGGLMYLARTLEWRGRRREMAGFLDCDVVMHDRPQGRGYVAFRRTAAHPWGGTVELSRAHEFHYARIVRSTETVFARAMARGHGIDGTHDGLVKARTLAGFVHLRHTRATPWVDEFLRFVAAAAAKRHETPPGTGEALPLPGASQARRISNL